LVNFAAAIFTQNCKEENKMTLPPLPTGLERDQTQHGRVYYTMRQMRECGIRCFDMGMQSTTIAGRAESKTQDPDGHPKLLQAGRPN